jgi:hypothetical protein
VPECVGCACMPAIMGGMPPARPTRAWFASLLHARSPRARPHCHLHGFFFACVRENKHQNALVVAPRKAALPCARVFCLVMEKNNHCSYVSPRRFSTKGRHWHCARILQYIYVREKCSHTKNIFNGDLELGIYVKRAVDLGRIARRLRHSALWV